MKISPSRRKKKRVGELKRNGRGLYKGGDMKNCPLSNGLNFVVSAREISIAEFATSIETVCKPLKNQDEAELVQSEALRIHKAFKALKSNITYGERLAINNLRKDDNIMILPADKGRSPVVMNKPNYIRKSNDLLDDTSTNKKLKSDQPNKHKKLISILIKLKEHVVSENTSGNKVTALSKDEYWKLYPTSGNTPWYYGLPNIHRTTIPLRSIISSINSITFDTANFHAKIISPLLGKTSYHIQNTIDFLDEIKGIRLQDVEEVVSYDVTAFFTSVPMDEALNSIHHSLESDYILHERTKLSSSKAVELLRFVLTTTCFSFHNQIPRLHHVKVVIEFSLLF